MNEQADKLGLRDTRYANAIGLDDPDNYSTARELATVATELMDNKELAKTVGRSSATLESGAASRTVENRNTLVSTRLVDGVKTGYTIDAGNVLVGSAEKNGARVISAVLGEPTESERDADTLALLTFGTKAFVRYEAVDAGRGALTRGRPAGGRAGAAGGRQGRGADDPQGGRVGRGHQGRRAAGPRGPAGRGHAGRRREGHLPRRGSG